MDKGPCELHLALTPAVNEKNFFERALYKKENFIGGHI